MSLLSSLPVTVCRMVDSVELWTTLELLVGRDRWRTNCDLVEELQEWLEATVARGRHGGDVPPHPRGSETPPPI